MKRLDLWTGVTAVGYVLVALLLILPLFGIFKHSLFDPESGQLSLANYREVVVNPSYRAALGHSLVVSIGGTVGAVLLGLPLALLTTRFRIPGSGVLRTLAILSLLSPPFIGAYAWILLLGSNGVLRRAALEVGVTLPDVYGPLGIVLVYALQYYPFVFLLTAGALRTIDRSVEEAAESLGATGWRKLTRVTLPLVLPSLSAGALIAFILSLANFGTPMILGRGYQVLPTLAYTLFTSELGTDPGQASAVCVVLIGVSSLALLLQRYASARRRVASALVNRPRVLPLTGWKQAGAIATCWGIVALSTLPLAVVALTSFRNTRGPVFQPGFGVDSYRQVLHSVPRAISNSLFYSLTATALIVGVGVLLGFVVSRRRNLATRILDPLLMTPYLVPGIVLGMGFIVVFNQRPLYLLGTGTIIVLAYFVRRLPYTIRSSAGILEQIDPAIEEAAVSLGAPPGEAFWKVTLPLMAPGILAGAILSWVTAVNELSASIVLYVGQTITMPIQIYLQVIDGYFGPAAALSTLLIGATGVALYAVDRVLGPRDEAYV